MRESLLRLAARAVVGSGLLRPIRFCVARRSARRGNRVAAGPHVKRARDHRYQVLVYHRVCDENDAFFPAVTNQVFAAQMQTLAEHFTVLPLDEAVARSVSGDLPPNVVCITFDDGYLDNYTDAYPVLRELGLPATIFLTTGSLEDGEPLWHDLVFEAFRCTGARQLDFAGQLYPLGSLSERLDALAGVLGPLKSCAPAVRSTRILEIRKALGIGEPSAGSRGRMLRWSQVVEMSRSGIGFGAHTVTHPILTTLPDREVETEVVRSKEEIERRIGLPVATFAYPNGRAGDFDDSTKRVLRAHGFRCAVTTLWGSNDSASDRFELRRVQAWEPNPDLFALRIALQPLNG